LSLTVQLPTTSSEYSLELDLARDVVPEQSQVKILSTRVLMFSLLLRCCVIVALQRLGHFLLLLLVAVFVVFEKKTVDEMKQCSVELLIDCYNHKELQIS